MRVSYYYYNDRIQKLLNEYTEYSESTRRFKKTMDLLGNVYAAEWDSNSLVVKLIHKNYGKTYKNISVYSLCSPKPYMFIAVADNKIFNVFNTECIFEGWFGSYTARKDENIINVRSAKKFILETGFDIEPELAYAAFGLIKSGNGFLDRTTAAPGYKEPVKKFEYGRYDFTYSEEERHTDEFNRYQRLVRNMKHGKPGTKVYPEDFDGKAFKNITVHYCNFAEGFYDFSDTEYLDLHGCDLRSATIKFNPNAKSVILSYAYLGPKSEYDFQNVKEIDASRVLDFEDIKFHFNPNAERIIAKHCHGEILNGDLDFSNVKYLDLERSCFGLVRSIKFNPMAEYIGISKSSFGHDCSPLGLDNCTNPVLASACEIYNQVIASQEYGRWLSVNRLEEHCNLSSGTIKMRLIALQSNPIMQEHIKIKTTGAGNQTAYLKNTPESIELFKQFLDNVNNLLSPSMLRKHCNISSHEAIEKYLSRMQNDKRMAGKIKPVYSNKAKREVLYLCGDQESILMFQRMLSELRFADAQRSVKSSEREN